MFYYYGRKKKIAKYYPAPAFNTIIEPFAGSAAYSCHGDNWQSRVILVEKDSRIAQIWRWLISEATPVELEKMRDLKAGEKSSELLHIIHAVTKMAFKFKTITVTPVLARNWEISKRVMAANIHKIKHWELIEGDYTEAPDILATWFIDPPYKDEPGMGYDHSSALMDYKRLAAWALTRKGEVICCEGQCGDYLPFRPLVELKGVNGKTNKEFVFYQKCVATSTAQEEKHKTTRLQLELAV